MIVIRMLKASTQITHSSQTGCTGHTYLAENILELLDINNHCDQKMIRDLPISFDFSKAFDILELTSLFGINMIKILCTNPLGVSVIMVFGPNGQLLQ